MGKKAGKFPDLREFVKENDQRLYDFCAYLLPGGTAVEDLALEIFRDFGDEYRKLARRRDTAWDPVDVRVRLFSRAWEYIQANLVRNQYQWVVGRDTRPMKNFDEDLIASHQSKEKNPSHFEDAAIERLARIDADFRAPVVLRDILKLDDEEVMRVLQTRWGVYRHRLHRGRLEFKEGLRGRPVRLELTRIASA
jgi:DNA-directed RNA polymerase specialized sigma24 family protein